MRKDHEKRLGAVGVESREL